MDHRLRLSLLALLAAALLSSCTVAGSSLTGTSWTLAAVDGAAPVAEGRLSFGADGMAGFATGCNQGSGSFTLEVTGLAFGDLATTKMGCDGPRGGQELAFLAVLSSAPAFELAAGRLTLRGGGHMLVFELAP
jgi:heat shock protein HslJ